MYTVFGNRVIDSKEMKALIEANSNFKVIKDMSRGSKREDILAFNLSVDISILKELMEEEDDISGLTEDELFDEYLALAEGLASEIEGILPEEAILDIRAYKWDKSDEDIKSVIAIAHEEVGERKLMDVMKGLLKQVE
jgi:hypothetical protein